MPKPKKEGRKPYLYKFDAAKNPKTAVFLDELRSDSTRQNYSRDIMRVLGDKSDDFLDLPKSNKEDILREHIKASTRKDSPRKISDAYANATIVAVKALCERYEQEINWSMIKRLLPKIRTVAKDRAPAKGEIRLLLKVADLRMTAATLTLSSSGMRAGGLAGLKVEDYNSLVWKGVQIATLRVYRGEPEEYLTFISPEAVSAIDTYLDWRQRKGETITGASPLFRDKYDAMSEKWREGHLSMREVNNVLRGAPKIGVAIPAHSLQQEFYKKWREAGVRKEKHGRGKPFEFKAVHGFRKYFRTFMPNCAQHAHLDVEVMMGHYLNYYKPAVEHLMDE